MVTVGRRRAGLSLLRGALLALARKAEVVNQRGSGDRRLLQVVRWVSFRTAKNCPGYSRLHLGQNSEWSG